MSTILHIAACPFPAPRGSQVFIAGSARGQVERGHRVAVACYANGEGEAPAGVELVRAARVPFAFGGSGPHPSKLAANLALARAVRRWSLENKPDLICAHNAEGPLVARLAGVAAPVFWEVHTRMQTELPRFLPGTAPLGRLLDLAAARSSDLAIALSDGGAHWVRELGIPTRLAPPAMDVQEVEGASASRARERWRLDDRVWAVYAGNADPYQDLGLLIDAMSRCERVGLLLVASDTSALAQHARQLGIHDERLRFVDSASFRDHIDAIDAADIGVLARGVCEGFPMKLFNYAALGKPTVAAGDSARPFPGVVAVPAGDATALARALQTLAQQPALRERLGREALRGARESSWSRRAERVEDILDAFRSGVTTSA
ncbi:MAG: glycosyltransferase family 4 protein [Proteobacteria bacterium]|nr:glycosyltransferase family 4 protein [Pseudomonadota bacterium]